MLHENLILTSRDFHLLVNIHVRHHTSFVFHSLVDSTKRFFSLSLAFSGYVYQRDTLSSPNVKAEPSYSFNAFSSLAFPQGVNYKVGFLTIAFDHHLEAWKSIRRGRLRGKSLLPFHQCFISYTLLHPNIQYGASCMVYICGTEYFG